MTFTGIPLSPASPVGAKALTWLQRGTRCGLPDPTVFQTLETCLTYVSVFLRPHIGTPRASWRESLTQAICFPVGFPHPPHRWWGKPVGSCSRTQVCSAEVPWRERGHQQWHHFGSLKTHLFAFVSQRSMWFMTENLERVAKCKKMQRRNSHNPTLQREPLLTFWLILFKTFFFC